MTSTIERTPAPDLASFDPFGPVFRADPEIWHEPLVAASPGFMTMAGVPSAWVASYAQATAGLRDPVGFSSLKPKGLPVMTYSDPPDHPRRRKVVNSAFLPKQTAHLTEEAGRIIDAAFDGAIDR